MSRSIFESFEKYGEGTPRAGQMVDAKWRLMVRPRIRYYPPYEYDLATHGYLYAGSASEHQSHMLVMLESWQFPISMFHVHWFMERVAVQRTADRSTQHVGHVLRS